MARVRTLLVLVALGGLLAASCGDDAGDATASTTALTTAPAQAAVSTTAAPNCSLKAPLKIVGLAEKPPEGPNAIPDYDEGFQLALDAIKNAGGVCGQAVQFERLPISPTDPNLAKNTYLQALDKQPHAIVGINASTAMIAIAPEVQKAQVPTIYFGTSPQVLANAPGGAGSPWGFLIRPITTGIAKMQVDYIVQDLGKKRIGLLCLNAPFGETGCNAVAARAGELGAQVVGREAHEATDTDMTAKVIALKNANPDVIIAYTFPNYYVTFINQLTDNGVDVPVFGTGANLSVASGAIKSAALHNVWGVEDCVPAGEKRVADWVAKYKTKFGKSVPSFAVAEAYDSIMMLAKVVESSGSTDAKTIADGLRNQTYDGVCATYDADAGQAMHHSSTFEQFDSAGTPSIKKTVVIPAV